MAARKLRYVNLIGYIVAMILTIVASAALIKGGAPVTLVLLSDACAWSGGIFFNLLIHTKQLEIKDGS